MIITETASELRGATKAGKRAIEIDREGGRERARNHPSCRPLKLTSGTKKKKKGGLEQQSQQKKKKTLPGLLKKKEGRGGAAEI
jgi:hypothetical protein